MTFKHSSFLSLKDAVVFLTGKEWEDTNAREFILEALREGKFRTRESEWDKSVERYVVRTIREAECGPGEISEWADLLDEEINWEQSSVAVLWNTNLESGGTIRRFGVDKLEIHKADFAKLLSKLEVKHDTEEGVDPAINERRNRRRRGRKLGDGARDDAQYLRQMKKLIESNKANSPNDAARQVVQGLADNPGASRGSTIQRLGRKFRKAIKNKSEL